MSFPFLCGEVTDDYSAAMKWARCAVAFGSVVALVSACGSDGPGAVAREQRTLSAMLTWFPAELTGTSSSIMFADLDGLRAGAKAASFEEDVRLLDERSGGGAVVPGVFSGSILDPEFAAYAGFDTRNIAAWAEVGEQPDRVTVMVGRFDAGAIEKALRTSPGSELLDVVREGGVTTFTIPTPAGLDIQAVSPIRPLGGPLAVALAGNVLVWGSDASVVAASLDAAAGAASVATMPVLADVAAALDAAAVTTGGVTVPFAGEAWSLAGYGETRTDGVSTVTLALRYRTADEAAAAAVAFRDHVAADESAADGEPWADTVTVVDSHADGATMVATLSTAQAMLVLRNLQRLDNLLTF